MPKFDDYVNIKRETDKDLFLHHEKTRGFGSEEVSSDYDLSFEQLNEHFAEREETGSILDRTKYYFQDAEVMEAKAARYRSIANPVSARDKTDMDMFSSKYKNHSARKRKKSAKQAAAAFKKTAKLEDKYKKDFENNSKVTSLDKLKHRKEIMTARLEGMEKAAAVKSTSKENEKYRILKARISCQRILREQARELLSTEGSKNQKMVLEGELSLIEAQLSEYENAMKDMMPPVAKQWGDGLGLPEAAEAKLSEAQMVNPEINEDDLEVQMKMNAMNSYMLEDETMRTMQNLEANGMYKGFKANVAGSSRIFAFGMRTVLRDKNGLPVNKEEAKKDKENQKWKDALARGNVEEKNRIIVSRFEDFMKIRIPTPEELQKKGVIGLLRENPAELNDIMNFSVSVGDIRKIDPFVNEYEAAHPEIAKKLKAAVHLSTVVIDILADKHLLKRGSKTYDISESVSKADSANVADVRNVNKTSFAKSYSDYIDGGQAYSSVVGKQLNSRQKASMDYFHKNFQDTFDGAMRKKLTAHMETELGGQIVSGEVKGDMNRSRNQAIMRNGLMSFLDKRQLGIAGGTEKSMYSMPAFSKEKVLKEIPGIKKKLPKQINKDFLQYAMDWTEDGDGIAVRANTEEAYGHVVNRIAKDGKKLLAIDINTFKYDGDGEFAMKIKDNYIWLKRAESLKSVVEIAKKDRVLKTGKAITLSALEGRIDTLLEVKADYDARIAMMNSNHYALQSQEDLDRLTDEELQEKINNASVQENHELEDFLNNYKTLRDKKDTFKMGSSVIDRERAISMPKMKQEAERQDAIYYQMKELGVFKAHGETKEVYEQRVLDKLIEKAKAKIPDKIDVNYIKANQPRINEMIGGLKPPEVQQLEIWFFNQMSDIDALKKKGLTDPEISKLEKVKEKLCEARRNADLQICIQEDFCSGWVADYNETPAQNPYLNKNHYKAMQAPMKALFNKVDTIGKTEKQKQVPLIRYMETVQQFTGIFVKHNIFFNKDLEGMVKKYEAGAQEMIQKEMEENKKVTVKIGDKDFELQKDFIFMNECKDLVIAPENMPEVEEKIKTLQELAKKIESCHLIEVAAKEGVYLHEVGKLRAKYGSQALKIKDEIKALAANS